MGKMEGGHPREEVADWTQEEMSPRVQNARFQALIPDLNAGRHPTVRVEQNAMESQQVGSLLRLDIPGQREKLLFGAQISDVPKMLEVKAPEFQGYFVNAQGREKFCSRVLKTLGLTEGVIRLPLLNPKEGLLVSVQTKDGKYRWVFCPMEMFQMPQKTRSDVKNEVKILEEYVEGRRERAIPPSETPRQVREGVVQKIKRLLRWKT